LTVTLPTSYEYTVSDDNVITATANEPMLGTLTSDNAYTFQHLAGVLRIQYAKLPVGAKSIKFQTNTRITGKFTATVGGDDTPELKQDEAVSATNGGYPVTINLSKATTSTIEDARFIIPLPTGTYKGFKVTVLDADGKVLQTYATGATNTLSLKQIGLYPEISLRFDESGSLEKEVTFDYTTITSSATGSAVFANDWTITNNKEKTFDKAIDYLTDTKDVCVKYTAFSSTTQTTIYTLKVPTGKKVTRIILSGYANDDSNTSYLMQLGSETFDATKYVFPSRKDKVNVVYSIVPSTPLEGDVTFYFGGKQVAMAMYVTYVE
jgi:hypothetical protein